MKKHFLFHLKEGSTLNEAIWELALYLSDIYEIDDPETGKIQIGGYGEDDMPTTFKHVELDQSSSAEEIDWQTQWASFAPDFHDGLAHIDLSSYGGTTLVLQPGGGFGDFSHPTTRLVLALMATHVKGKTVFDIGCGSGILTIAAILFGAKHAYGIDIDEDAIEHSIDNAVLNHVEKQTEFSLEIAEDWLTNEPCVIVMNMIETEQLDAWQSSHLLHRAKALIITSGILASQRDHYLKLAQRWKWMLQEEKEEEGWVGFVFSQN